MVKFGTKILTDQVAAGFFVLFSGFSVLCFDGNRENSIINLDDYCKAMTSPALIDIPCDKNAQERAGTLQFNYYPDSCNFTLTVNGVGCSYSSYALYLSFRFMNFEDDDSIEIYDESTLVKKISGSPYSHSLEGLDIYQKPPFAHLLSSFRHQPSLEFQLKISKFTNLDSNRTNSQTEKFLILNYEIVREQYDYKTETLCASLQCKSVLTTSVNSDYRVGCPMEYKQNLGVDQNVSKDHAAGYRSLIRCSKDSIYTPEIINSIWKNLLKNNSTIKKRSYYDSRSNWGNIDAYSDSRFITLQAFNNIWETQTKSYRENFGNHDTSSNSNQLDMGYGFAIMFGIVGLITLLALRCRLFCRSSAATRTLIANNQQELVDTIIITGPNPNHTHNGLRPSYTSVPQEQPHLDNQYPSSVPILSDNIYEDSPPAYSSVCPPSGWPEPDQNAEPSSLFPNMNNRSSGNER